MEERAPRSTDDAVSLPMVPLRDIVVFPGTMVPFVVGRRPSLLAVEQALAGDRRPDGSGRDCVRSISGSRCRSRYMFSAAAPTAARNVPSAVNTSRSSGGCDVRAGQPM